MAWAGCRHAVEVPAASGGSNAGRCIRSSRWTSRRTSYEGSIQCFTVARNNGSRCGLSADEYVLQQKHLYFLWSRRGVEGPAQRAQNVRKRVVALAASIHSSITTTTTSTTSSSSISPGRANRKNRDEKQQRKAGSQKLEAAGIGKPVAVSKAGPLDEEALNAKLKKAIKRKATAKALETFCFMRNNGLLPTESTYKQLINHLCNARPDRKRSTQREALKVFEDLDAYGLRLNPSANKALALAAVKQDKLESALILLERVEQQEMTGGQLSISIYTALINSLSRKSDSTKHRRTAEELWERLRSSEVRKP